MCVNESIKQIREEKGLSQRQLAEKLKKLNQSQLSKIETGKRKISVPDLIDISDALGVSMSAFMKGEDT